VQRDSACRPAPDTVSDDAGAYRQRRKVRYKGKVSRRINVKKARGLTAKRKTPYWWRGLLGASGKEVSSRQEDQCFWCSLACSSAVFSAWSFGPDVSPSPAAFCAFSRWIAS